jgi:hypothetical protein
MTGLSIRMTIEAAVANAPGQEHINSAVLAGFTNGDSTIDGRDRKSDRHCNCGKNQRRQQLHFPIHPTPPRDWPAIIASIAPHRRAM